MEVVEELSSEGGFCKRFPLMDLEGEERCVSPLGERGDVSFMFIRFLTDGGERRRG